MKAIHNLPLLLALWLVAGLFLFLPKATTAEILESKVRHGKQILCMTSGLIGAWEECGTENYIDVLRGRVTKVVEVSEWELKISVTVDEVFKGDLGSTVMFGSSQGICFDDLNEGSEWVFFLEKDEKTGEPFLNYYSHNSSGPVTARGEVLERLRELKSSPGEGMIIGSVHGASHDRPSFDSSPLPEQKVVASNSRTGKEYKTITDSKGRFSLTQLPAGSYSLKPSGLAGFPEDLMRKFKFKIDVAHGGCYQVDLAAGK
jgi:hypothetical protein